MKKLFITIIIAVIVLGLLGVLKQENNDVENNIQNSLTNSSVTNTNTGKENKVEKENKNELKNNEVEEQVQNNIIENENIKQDENIEEEPKQEQEQDQETNNSDSMLENVPDNSYVGKEENSKDDYDTELDGENKAIVLVKQYLGDKASNYTFNVETTTSLAYVVRAMDESSSNTYYSVNFTTWVVSEI